jgi:hypothetical protein
MDGKAWVMVGKSRQGREKGDVVRYYGVAMAWIRTFGKRMAAMNL